MTDGVEAALEQARAAAGGRDVHVAGGGEAPLLGDLDAPVALERTRMIESPAVTRPRYGLVEDR